MQERIFNPNEKEFLYFYMDQTCQEMRHIENLRERLTILVVTVASAMAGFIIQQRFALETKPFPFFIITLGVFGLLATQKLFQIHQMAQCRLNRWYKYILEFCGPDAQILRLRDEADQETRKKFSISSEFRHNYFWLGIHAFVVLVGIFTLTKYP